MTELYQANPVYFSFAIAGTALFLIKTILMLVGGDADMGEAGDSFDVSFDGEAESHMDSGESFTLFSIQSVLAFFMGCGWMGLAARHEFDVEKMPAVFIAVGFGFLLMFLNAWLMAKVKGLNSASKNDITKAVGLRGRAYTDIPEKGSGMGQIEITVNGKQQILNAFSEEDKIKSFASVLVTDVDDSGNVVVREDQ